MAHWVQIEKDPNGSATGYLHIDLEKVELVAVDRATLNDSLLVQVQYVDKTVLTLKQHSGPIFLEFWNEFCKIPEDRIPPEAQPGKIQTVRSGNTGGSGNIVLPNRL